MIKAVIIIVIILAFVIISVYFLSIKTNETEMPQVSNGFSIASPAFQGNAYIPAKYTCDGENILPPLSIGGTPAETKSLVLIVDDPDAPRGVWTHLLVWNIQSETTAINEGKLPEGTVGKNSSGKLEYGGPCPPSGAHRYFFKVYALDAVLNLDKNSGIEELNQAILGHVIAEANLVGLYKRVYK